jgi:hypothetical protein
MAHRPYPVDEVSVRVRTTVRIPKQQNDDIELMSDLWSLLDAARDVKRDKKWKAASVIERLVATGIDQFWEQVGGRPHPNESDEQFVRRALEKLKKSSAR